MSDRQVEMLLTLAAKWEKRELRFWSAFISTKDTSTFDRGSCSGKFIELARCRKELLAALEKPDS